MDFVNIFITFDGRINRAKFWIGALILGVINAGLMAIALFSGRGTTVYLIANIVNLLVVISGLSVAAKRLHDRNKSGWFVLLFWLVPAALLAIGELINDTSGVVATALWLIAVVIGIWSFVELGCLRGTIGNNQYGPDPLAPEVLTPPVRTHA